MYRKKEGGPPWSLSKGSREDPRYLSTTDGKDLSVSNHRVRPG